MNKDLLRKVQIPQERYAATLPWGLALPLPF
jgi:hypothetical protein